MAMIPVAQMTNPEGESLFVPETEARDAADEDGLSATSSDDEDDDNEFEVEMVLSERPDPGNPGGFQYLIKWENYPMDQSTWEPLQNLGEGVLQGWEEAKAEIKAGTRAEFDLNIFEKAVKAAESQAALEERRPSTDSTSSEPVVDNHNISTEQPFRSDLPRSRSTSAERQDAPSHASPHVRDVPNTITKENEGITKSGSDKRVVATQAQPGTKSGSRYQGTGKVAKALSAKPITSKPIANAGRSKPIVKPGALAPSLSSSLRDKFYGKTARRSGPVSHIIMPGEQGIRPRKRRKADNNVDPSKDPKPFNTMRRMNNARKQAIQRSEQAPRDVTAIPAHFLMSNDRSITTAVRSTNTVSEAGSVTSDKSTGDAVTVPKKAKKAVRFTGAGGSSSLEEVVTVESPQEMMEIDDAQPSAGKKLTLSSYQARHRTKTFVKSCSFGPSGSSALDVSFSDVPHSSEPWITTFLDATTISFDRECRFDDFSTQRTALVSTQSHLGSAHASSTDDNFLIANVAANLKQEGTALLLFRSQYCMLMFPCDALNWLNALGRSPLPDTPNCALTFLLFKPSSEPQLFPTPSQIVLQNPVEQPADLVRLFRDVLCLDPRVLRPRDPAEEREQVFMLCFSAENQMLCQWVALWLRTVQPGCRIYIYAKGGAWKTFIKDLHTSPGALIFDEILSPRIRRFPKIWHLVDAAKCCTFWCLASGESINPPRFPSNDDVLLAPSQYQFTQLFPHGRVFFLTPSFVATDPKGLCEFLEWFIEWGANPGYLVVTSHDFLAWMHNLVKQRLRHFRQEVGPASTGLSIDRMLEDVEGEKQDLELRKKAINLWHSITEKYGNEQMSDSLRKLESAPPQLHASDEQSLVNWFCWWSLRRLDRHRRFTVIGSHAQTGIPCSVEFTIPNYPEDMAADPDAEEIEVEKVIAHQRDAQITAWRRLHPGAVPNVDTQYDLRVVAGEPAFSGVVLRSSRIEDISAWLRNLKDDLATNWSKVLPSPVAYVDRDMAEHFHDPMCASATFKQWLYEPLPFSRYFNTWMGLFYTIDGRWDDSRPATSYKRRPWIAIYRPMYPHELRNPYKAMELLIWDISADEKLAEARDLSCLDDMQTRLVDFVRNEAGHDDVEEYYLARAWIGSRLCEDIDPGSHPLEATCSQLKVMALEGRYWLPPKDHLLIERGWTKLKLSKPAIVSSAPALSQAELFGLAFPKTPADHERPEQIIFHPLRSQSAEHRTSRRKLSRCSNDMYRAAMEARCKVADCPTAVLQYRPTLSWYADLKAEKRDASHVCVQTWEAISTKLGRRGQRSAPPAADRPSSRG
ncbi:uncharacterized protein B0I36DRAFT_29255 [Microdochium trichocladiopsis]|uniref:Chromo domain-containing protein n=1 Tax=Microdochium trichocladiopsis TaxID=1682393 RepID=A0A9P8XVV2_9PEZI|nr:uncharacterized protein B0I36DRAFT_29255 [Microdochium trichocladiopsis]KAH7021125.1 hypothetical protein B0I36DRAFT_29255 [Microdochium trichocladiopsis]